MSNLGSKVDLPMAVGKSGATRRGRIRGGRVLR